MKLNDIARKIAKDEVGKINVALPARILEYRPTELRAKIELLAKKELEGEMKVVPPILEVPVMTIKAGAFVIMPPYEKDDVGQVIFNDKALDKLLITGEPEEADLKREHSLDDAVFLGGLQTEQEDDLPDPGGNLLISSRDESIKLELTPDGELEIEADGDVNIDCDTANIDGDVNLAGGGPGIARQGDDIQVKIPSGSSSGTYQGSIISSSDNATSG